MTLRSAEYYRDAINSLERIPSLPAIATELMVATQNDDLSVAQLLPIIEKDPPLAMKVLKIANSAYYGMNQRVESLRHAIVILGMQELRDLSLGFSVITTLSKGQTSSGLNWQMLWEHSAAVGHISQLLMERLGLQLKSSPYALGLLHDIGKIVLYRLEPELYQSAVNHALEEELSSEESEQAIIGVDHMQIGAWVAEKWKLPLSISQTIQHHHNPEKVEDQEIRISASLIQMADIVANLQSISFGKFWMQSIPREESGWTNLVQESANMADLDLEHFIMSIEDELISIRDMVKLMSRE